MTPREIRMAIDGTTGIVVITLAAALANLTWRVFGEPGDAAPLATAARSYVRPAPPPDLSALINIPPFGSVVVAPAATLALPNLTLKGVLFANPGSASTALIASGQDSSVAYRTGENLPGGARVERIAEDYVVLAIGGQYANLYFPGDERAKRPVVATAPAANVPGGANANAGVEAIRALLPPSVRGGTGAAPPGGAAPNVSPTAAGVVARLGATATPQGLRFGPTIPPHLRNAGLMPGDMITNINGVDATAFANDGGLIREAMSTGQARVEILRNGIRVSLSVPFR